MKKTLLTSLALAGLLLASPSVASAAEIVNEGFDYTHWSTGDTPMNANWTVHSGSNPVSIALTHATLPVPHVSINNGVAYTSFSETITGDFELSVNAIHPAYSRLLWFGLFNATGTQGYVFYWNSATDTTWGAGEGYVQIKRFDSAPISYQTAGVNITSQTVSGHNAITAPFANLKLTWVDATNTLSISVDGVVKGSLVDNTLDASSFARIYLAGNGGTRFDDVVLTAAIPEPSTYAAAFGGVALAGALLSRRRRN